MLGLFQGRFVSVDVKKRASASFDGDIDFFRDGVVVLGERQGWSFPLSPWSGALGAQRRRQGRPHGPGKLQGGVFPRPGVFPTPLAASGGAARAVTEGERKPRSHRFFPSFPQNKK